ncbi:melanotransferrin-like [Elysia marginata]|uniref:Melanotransferrin-like n=1 Tax=Elysia marginata TaxID=1093978 RepID=A0AAV4FZ95_9GAST|nr:melanotransferrin-like [Elysia marginata]
MENLLKLCLVLSVVQLYTAQRPTRWCVTNKEEEIKCNFLKKQMSQAVSDDPSLANKLPEDFQCVRQYDQFSCMEGIEQDNVDLIALDSGQAYFAGRQYNMMPIMAESYQDSAVTDIPSYYSVAVFRVDNPVSLQNLRQKKVCFSGIGMSAGWVHPIGRLLKDSLITVDQCNAIVKAVNSSFAGMCLPGALTSFYNPFGNNPTAVCRLCGGYNEEFCTTSDLYAGYDGSFRCVAEGSGHLTFVRHDTIDLMTDSTVNSTGLGSQYSRDNFRLLCPDRNGRTASVDDFENCNWGKISSNLIMTSAVRDPDIVEGYKTFLRTIDELFGPSGTRSSDLNIFTTLSSYPGTQKDIVRKNLMFSDMTKKLVDIGDNNYFTWVADDFNTYLSHMSQCPSNVVRWCVISLAEKLKCEDMIMAFKAKDLRPEMDCLYGGNTSNCMEMIWRGDADLMNLDAGDVYIAGRRYGLIPIAAEDYGDMTMQFKVVAAAQKTDKSTTLFNMKGKRSCQPGIGRGDGFGPILAKSTPRDQMERYRETPDGSWKRQRDIAEVGGWALFVSNHEDTACSACLPAWAQGWLGLEGEGALVRLDRRQ